MVVFVSACSWCDDLKPHVCHVNDAGTDGRPEPVTTDACIGPRVQAPPDPACPDDFEPNGDFVMAATSNKHECDKTTKTATIADEADVDVFRTGTCSGLTRYYTSDPIKPWASIENDGLRLCIYPICSDGSTRVYGCYEDKNKDPTVEDLMTAQVGFHGCCRTGKGRITAKLDCPNSWGEIDMYIWVDQPASAQTCTQYTVTYQAIE